MHGLALFTRFREGSFEGNVCLLVYDLPDLSGAHLSSDFRDLLDQHPNTPRICLLAPFHSVEAIRRIATHSTALQRLDKAVTLDVATLHASDPGKLAVSTTSLHPTLTTGEYRPATLNKEIIEGWMADLFRLHRGLVSAPPGVHFGKGSQRHADRFLRTSNLLLSSKACAVCAYFALAATSGRQPRRLFVDTAPLLSVALMMQRIAAVHGFWEVAPPSDSFSSYGGVDQLPLISKDDLFLISASTSGGLAKKLVEVGAQPASVVTLYLLESTEGSEGAHQVVCDLTYRPGRTFGYSKIENYRPEACPMCRRASFLARLEGDQFLLQKRAVKRLRIVKTTQTEDARKLFEVFSRHGALGVRLRDQQIRQPEIDFDLQRLLKTAPEVKEQFVRVIRRFAPAPLDAVVLVGWSLQAFHSFVKEAGLERQLGGIKAVVAHDLGWMEPVEGGGVLVFVGVLNDHAALRQINAQLRTIVPGGCVGYVSAVTVAESRKHLADLRVFLQFGEHGPETFIFRSAFEVMLPPRPEGFGAWELEAEYLMQLRSDGKLPTEMVERLAWLEATGTSASDLFLNGKSGQLRLARDFAFLDTTQALDSVTQGDVFALVSNLLASARNDGVSLRATSQADSPAALWSQSVYGQTLLCPSVFRLFNDAVLRAAFLRAAHRTELDYSSDLETSQEVADVVVAELQAWLHGKGDALPEFALALATSRLRLVDHHVANLVEVARTCEVPDYIKLMLASRS